MNKTINRCGFVFALAVQCAFAHAADPAAQEVTDEGIARGKYLVQFAGCNDCHTEGYMPSNGEIPVDQWLGGSVVGFQGPWGTTYPANLRLIAAEVSEEQWRERLRHPMRPPMPWFNLQVASDDDLTAMYRFIRSLGPMGEPAPLAAAPGEAVNTPYFDFTPKNLPKHAGVSN